MIRGLLLVLLAAGICRAHEPITTKLTWTREISRIVYKRCAGCHREGARAPMSLLTYDEARPWAKAIRDEVLARRMPPWGPVKGFGEFRDDPSLSEIEIQLLVNWVEGGAPNGDDVYALPPPPAPAEKAAEPIASEKLDLRDGLVLTRAVSALGVEPAGPVKITVDLPSGRVEPLLWLRDLRPAQPKAYYFRDPLSLGKGTRIHLDGEPAALLISAP